MSQPHLELSEYRGMWLFAMFDLPVVDREARRVYTHFRNALLKDGFMMLQFSVYARYCPSEEASEIHRKRVRQVLPERGQVRMLSVTDRQFAKMDVFHGRKRQRSEDVPAQLMLF